MSLFLFDSACLDSREEHICLLYRHLFMNLSFYFPVDIVMLLHVSVIKMKILGMLSYTLVSFCLFNLKF